MVKDVQSDSTKPSAKFMQDSQTGFSEQPPAIPFHLSAEMVQQAPFFNCADISACLEFFLISPLGCSPSLIPKITKFIHASWVPHRHLL